MRKIQMDREIDKRLELIHKEASSHRDKLEDSDICGCFYCKRMFHPDKIVEWIDDEQTALCPKCGIDSVLPLKVADFDLLNEMYSYWFGWAIDSNGVSYKLIE
jgi:hypothetical protein